PSTPAAGPSASPSGSPSPSASPSPSYPAGVDPCLLGTWRTTTATNYGLIDGDRVQYTGGAGVISVYKADNTVTYDYDHSAPYVADYGGHRWEGTHRGQAVFRYSAVDGEMLQSKISSTARNTLTRDGKYNAGGATTYNLEPGRYRCTETTLVETSTLGNYSAESVRVG
ncbi:hypothetical protein ABZS66_27700, partial [Dactylosporangium sp. NPDC005572]|uniref:hypothetical protein n=1 Tax=Dactylosporangium sp. NPDC005572 TaxID=3156889 RepID=UPI0033A4B9D3